MAYGILGTLSVGQDPNGYDAGSLNRQRNWGWSYSNLFSVNNPIIISAYWNLLNENQEPSAQSYNSGTQEGHIVNVIFDVYQISEASGVIFPDDWTLVGSIRKSRDIRNISEMDRVNGGDGVSTAQGHIFTVDISEMCRDLLSYSLVPHGKGTWANTFWGGLNGGADQQGNRFEFIGTDIFSVTKNGSYRKIKVQIRCEIIDGEGIIREATTGASIKETKSSFGIINSALDYDNPFVPAVRQNLHSFIHLGWGTSNRYWRSFMTTANNGNWGGTINANDDTRVLSKDVRMDEAAEYLQWVMGTVNNYAIWHSGFDASAGETSYGSNNTSDLTDQVWIEITAKDADWNTVRNAELYDFTQNFKPKETVNSIANVWPRSQYRMCSQNISPVFINANCIHKDSAVKDVWENGGETYTRHLIDVDGNPSDKTALFLNDEITYYTLSIYNKTITSGNGTGASKRLSEIRYFKIDRDRWTNTSGANTGDRYAGIYYTELRSDQMTLAHPVRCKGFRWIGTGAGLTNHDKYFRVHWLNKCGGIDSYTIKGQKSITYNAERDIIQRKEPNRFDYRIGGVDGANPYPSDNAPVSGNYLSDNMGKTNNYKGGLEVLNINATKSGRVTTLPMGTQKAEWLKEILTSTNVWTEYLTMNLENGGLWYKTAYRGVDDLTDGSSTAGRLPNNMDYVPLVITSSSVDTYDEAKGLVTMTFEYTHSHAVVTQRN